MRYKMTILFWQNTNSIHQSSFLNELAKKDEFKICLIITEPLDERRKKMGWIDPHLENIDILDLRVNRNNTWKKLILSNLNSIHIFSGIAAFSLVHKAFNFAIKNKCQVGILTEPLDFRGVKGFFRYWRGFYHKHRYNNSIMFLLATGKNAVDQFRRWGYSSDKIFEWGYTVSSSTYNFLEKNKTIKTSYKLMFAGSLIERKGYDILVDSLKMIAHDFTADFYCLNDEELVLSQELKQRFQLDEKINFLPFLSNDRLRAIIHEYDVFVLPSRHDGWGAVINESLMEGTPVIVSAKCGSCTLVVNSFLGDVMSSLNSHELASLIRERISLGPISVSRRNEIRTWSELHISGASMAKYFAEIIEYKMKIGQKPIVPWNLN